MLRPLPLPLLLALGLSACRHEGVRQDPPASASSVGVGFVWPVPEKWRSETIPFPLEFAPDLPYRGVEELRFAPAFFEPSAPGYFSYAFVWWLEGRPALDRPTLERDLARYFAGLCDAVGGKKFRFDPARFKARLESSEPRADRGFPLTEAFRGTLDAYDPFKNGEGREITLNLDLSVGDCPAAGRRVLLVKASPKPRFDAIWGALADREASFRCP